MDTTLCLVRHGETDWNAEHRIQGGTDIPLNDTGRAQALAAAQELRRHYWSGVYSSPLCRAFETAEIIAAELRLPAPLRIPAVHERRFGEIEGLTLEERIARFGDESEVPGLESRADVVARAQPALTTLAHQHPGEQLLIVSHGGVIGSLMRFVTDSRRPRPQEYIHNGSANEFSVSPTGHWSLSRYDARPGRTEYRPVP
ncbi:histidine phosphatase family protein [Pseudoclavibacter sp. CFCC 13611]|uniref:histidine phosphatase family protein n=1 Tax=Pseudoclavibacter sp. CFCC 13611 TaxID=2615178 RepID=UPI001300D71F|nr:histidine phosphatase family protein [Pseudoclavibacter sp. CFCC 13611]KAB1663502.1 histidine phosphatase family protein [Pseudoclavibacter sp. CFCC 13611]